MVTTTTAHFLKTKPLIWIWKMKKCTRVYILLHPANDAPGLLVEPTMISKHWIQRYKWSEYTCHRVFNFKRLHVLIFIYYFFFFVDGVVVFLNKSFFSLKIRTYKRLMTGISQDTRNERFSAIWISLRTKSSLRRLTTRLRFSVVIRSRNVRTPFERSEPFACIFSRRTCGIVAGRVASPPSTRMVCCRGRSRFSRSSFIFPIFMYNIVTVVRRLYIIVDVHFGKPSNTLLGII